MEKRNRCKSGDSLMTARAVVAIEINVPKFEKSKILIKLCANLEWKAD